MHWDQTDRLFAPSGVSLIKVSAPNHWLILIFFGRDGLGKGSSRYRPPVIPAALSHTSHFIPLGETDQEQHQAGQKRTVQIETSVPCQIQSNVSPASRHSFAKFRFMQRHQSLFPALQNCPEMQQVQTH